jgi:hypothetical protein
MLADFAPSDRGEVVSIEPVVERLSFKKPFATAEVAIRGKLVDGSAWNATYACDSWESSDPELATVDRYGTVSALRPGRGTITARLGELEATVAFEVGFAAVVELDHRPPRHDDPVLRATIAADAITVELDRALPNRRGWLAVGLEPYRSAFCRELVFVDFETAEKIPLPEPDDRGQCRLLLPVAPAMRGRTVYLQGFSIDTATPCQVRTTNALAVTLTR